MPDIRLELVIDGVVHYDKVHSPETLGKQIEILKNHVFRSGYKESYELSKYIMSKPTNVGMNKLNEADKQRAVNMLSMYAVNVVARRYNVSNVTIRNYRREILAREAV